MVWSQPVPQESSVRVKNCSPFILLNRGVGVELFARCLPVMASNFASDDGIAVVISDWMVDDVPVVAFILAVLDNSFLQA